MRQPRACSLAERVAALLGDEEPVRIVRVDDGAAGDGIGAVRTGGEDGRGEGGAANLMLST
eukprot:CAMPEP_0119329658 /NCGR_PEP_ID=MMETSP1333-20130426/76378_1 /TAXON_ID=418940 /ORGANISM="Scyphosphaera apsteinii, Strain RCC1455" /LENGTH=60 /DNA_ID=CAMNT_0007338827 /DNA_START=46 /DNA_END=226 /DNA_ORIENTATION=+